MTDSSANTCLLCGRSDGWSEVISHQLRDDSSGRFSVVRCASCGHVQLTPLPTAEEDRAFYAADRQAKNLVDTVDFDRMQKKSAADTRRRLDWLRSVVPATQGSRVLDIGSGYGFFVHEAVQAGYQALGLNISDAQLTLARANLEGDFQLGTLDDEFAAGHAGEFACVTAFHVLEHLADPVGFIKLASSRLAPGGFLLIEVPNLSDSLLQEIPEYRAFYWQRAHLSYFDPVHLQLVFYKAGVLSFEIGGVQRYGVRNLLNWLDNRRPQLEEPDYHAKETILHDLEKLYKSDRERSLTCDTLIATITT